MTRIVDNKEKIIKCLCDSARKSIKQISIETGISRQATSRIIKQLEEDKIIWGYTPIIDYSFIGKKTFYLFIKINHSVPLNQLGSDIQKEFAEDTHKNLLGFNNDIIWVDTTYMHGEYDMLLKFLADDLLVAKEYVNSLISKFSYNGISAIQNFELSLELFPMRLCTKPNPDTHHKVTKLFEIKP